MKNKRILYEGMVYVVRNCFVTVERIDNGRVWLHNQHSDERWDMLESVWYECDEKIIYDVLGAASCCGGDA